LSPRCFELLAVCACGALDYRIAIQLRQGSGTVVPVLFHADS
jgi:hypothetical protein